MNDEAKRKKDRKMERKRECRDWDVILISYNNQL